MAAIQPSGPRLRRGAAARRLRGLRGGVPPPVVRAAGFAAALYRRSATKGVRLPLFEAMFCSATHLVLRDHNALGRKCRDR